MARRHRRCFFRTPFSPICSQVSTIPFAGKFPKLLKRTHIALNFSVARIRERGQKLIRFHERITACRFFIAEARRQHQKGTLFHVRIDLSVPDGEIVVNREPELDHAH